MFSCFGFDALYFDERARSRPNVRKMNLADKEGLAKGFIKGKNPSRQWRVFCI